MTEEQFKIRKNLLQDEYTPLEVSTLAARNEMPDKPMSYVNWLLWYMLRDIYNEFTAGTLTKEQGAARKKQAIDIYNDECEYLGRMMEMYDRMAELWKGIEAEASAYRKDRTLENADALMKVVYGFI